VESVPWISSSERPWVLRRAKTPPRPPAQTAGAARDPLLWISPGRINPAVTPPRARLLSWPRHHIRVPTVTIRQDRTTLTRRRLPWPVSPGRVSRIPSSLLAGATAKNGPVTVDIA
jgi:hypothetical protein